MKLRRKLLLGLLGVLLLTPMAALYLVASTQVGLRIVAAHLGKMGRVTVTAQQVGGTLTGGFTVGSLHVLDRHADVLITGASGQLRLLPLLLQRRIELTHAEAQNVTVKLLEFAGERLPGPRHFLPPTLRVATDSARANSVDVIERSGRTLHGTTASAAVEVLPRTILIRDGQLDWEDMHLAVDGRVLAADPTGLTGHVAGDWHAPGKPAWRFTLQFAGDLARLGLKLDISQPFHAQLDGAATELNGAWRIAGDTATNDLDIGKFGAGNALGIIAARGKLVLNAQGFSFDGPVTAPGLQAGPVQVDFHGAYANHRLTIGDTTLLHQPSGSRATVHGTVDETPDGPRLALAGRWTTIRWPLTAAEPAFTSVQGQYAIDGTRPWKVDAAGEISAAGMTSMPASVHGSLAADSLTIQQATLGILGGNATVAGEAHWHPAEDWAVVGHMSGLDPARLRDDLPGRLDFDFHAAGSPFGKTGGIDFTLSHLAGTLRGQSASGSGQFTKPAGSAAWQFHQVDLKLGHAHIQLDGGLGTTRDIRFAIDADDLSLFDPGARGRISARGRYAGTADTPLLLFKARGNDFEWQGYRVDTLDADLDVDLQGQGHTQGKVELAGIHHGARTVQQATLNLAGTGTAQQLNLDVNAPPLRALLMASGMVDKGAWQGEIQNLSVNDGAELALRLEQSAPVSLDLQSLNLGNLCLTGDKARGCVSARRGADGRWSSTFSAQDMPLRAFTAGLTQDMDYMGTINLRGNLAGSPGSLPTGSVSGELMQAELRHILGNGRIDQLALGSGRVQAQATSSDFWAQVELDAGTSGEIKGSLTGERNKGDWRDYPINGRLEARTDGMSLLDMYVGGIDKATGQLSTSIDIVGTLGDPVLAGQLHLRDASIDAYQVNLALRALSLDAQFDRQTISLTGQSRLGDGMAHVSGKLTWRDNQPLGTLHVEGERLRIVNVPEARIDASPKLDFKLDGRRIEASGEVLIPWARLEPADLTSAVLASGDEVLVGAPPVAPEQRWTVVSDVKLALGDDVSIKGLGLQATLGGGLQVRTDETQTSRGQGVLSIKSGKYRAYGRLMDINSGRLIFNGPLDNPGVELRAQKEFTDVTAGVNVRGTLRAPRITFYSDPELPQSQIAALLLAGGSLESVQNNSAPGAARNELLTQAGGIIGQRIGSHVGIDDIGVESDFTGNAAATGTNSDTSLVLGKYLTDRIYISYGISLAEAINTFKLRWTIAKGWTLKTEVGQARSADLVYTITKGARKKDKAEDKAEDNPGDKAGATAQSQP
jgi:translocation and assembly module TamB